MLSDSDKRNRVVLGLIILFFILAFFLCSCSSARRRRRAGLAPYAGTGWAARPWNRNDPYYANNGQNWHQGQAYPPPPPQYSQGMPEGHYAYNQYGQGQQGGIELQQPQQAYGQAGRSGGDVWSPPQGPPPAKGYH